MFITTPQPQLNTKQNIIRNDAPFRWPLQTTIETQLKKEVAFAAGETIGCPTARCNYVYVILEGIVTIEQRGQATQILQEGDFVGGFDSWGITAVSQTDSHLVAISQKQARMLANHPPYFVAQIVETMVGTLTWQAF